MNVPLLPAPLAPLTQFVGARDAPRPSDRLAAVRAASRQFRAEMLRAPSVDYYQSVELVRAPYPVRFGMPAARVLTPYLHIVNRMFLVQWRDADRVWTMLVSPTDYANAADTPFFARLRDQLGVLAPRITPWIGPATGDVLTWLVRVGIAPESVDFITFDHLHTQDLRRWLGTDQQPAALPNARLLVMRTEWESVHGLLPLQAEWYHPAGVQGIDPARVVLLDGDTWVGPSVALLHTPGHTAGNHSIVVRTPEGLLVTSENGIGPDAYAPHHSRIPGVRDWAVARGAEVVLNSNTLEGSTDQYLSMVQEKEVAGPSPRDPRFYNVVCSSEFDAFVGFPGIQPTFRFGDLCFGAPIRAQQIAVGA